MADKIVVLDGDYVSQVGKPLDLYHYPQNRFVAGFYWLAEDELYVHIEQAEAEGAYWYSFQTAWLFGSCWCSTLTLVTFNVARCSASEALDVCHEAGDATIEGEVMIVEKLGNETQVYLNLRKCRCWCYLPSTRHTNGWTGRQACYRYPSAPLSTCSTAMAKHVVACTKKYGTE